MGSRESPVQTDRLPAPEAAPQGDASPAPARAKDAERPRRKPGKAVRIAGREFRRATLIRFGVAVAIVAGSIAVDRPAFGWGLFVIFAVAAVPLGRARSFAFSFIPYAGVWFIFTALRALADETILARTLNTHVPSLERWLFGGQLPTIRLQDRFFDANHLHWYDYFFTSIHWSYFVVPHVVAIVTWHKNPRLFRHFLSAMTLLLAVGLAIYFLIPTNPPWLAPEQIDSPAAPYVHRIMNNVAVEIGGGFYRASYRVIGESNPRAAMPSIHMAFTFLLVFPAFRAGRWWGYLALVYSALMGYALMYLGEHYFVDVMVGVIVTSYGWFATRTWIDHVLPVVTSRYRPRAAPAAAAARE